MKRLLILKHGALGDIIQGLDAFASLRASDTQAYITILTSPPFAGLMRAMPYFDRVVVDERAPFYQFWKLGALNKLFQSDFDIIIDLQCSKRTAIYHKYFAPDGQRWLGTAKGCSDPYPDFTNVNNADRMMTAAKMLGALPIKSDLSFLGNDEARDKADDAGKGLVFDKPYGVLMPGCSPAKPSKRWPATHYAELAQLMLDDGILPVIIGTKVDEDACRQIADNCPAAINLMGRTSLAQLAALCAKADMSIGNDSGPVFLAAKTGALTLMLMGPDTDPAMSAPQGDKAHYLTADALATLPAARVYQTILNLKKTN